MLIPQARVRFSSGTTLLPIPTRYPPLATLSGLITVDIAGLAGATLAPRPRCDQHPSRDLSPIALAGNR